MYPLLTSFWMIERESSSLTDKYLAIYAFEIPFWDRFNNLTTLASFIIGWFSLFFIF